MKPTRHPLAGILATIVNVQEQEGNRIARLLHDEVGQILSAVGLQMDLLRMDVEADSPEIARRIVESQKILEQAVNQVRTLSYELNPDIVNRAGLRAALEELTDRYREISQRPVSLTYNSSAKLPARVAGSMYKIAECALDNAVKHSGCQRIEVLVRPGGGGTVLEVKDDGAGFDVEEAMAEPAGLGLLLMDCYSDQGGLQFEVTSKPGDGTIVRMQSRDTGPATD